MTNQEKISLLEEMLELDGGSLKEELLLEKIEEWDSMAALSLIVLMEEEFGKKLSSEQIRSFVKIKDILDFMG